MNADPIFQDAESRRRFELHVAGQVVYADDSREAETLVIRHVYSPPPLRGTGAADRLMSEIAAQARTESRKIVAICGCAHAWLRRHKAHRDLLSD